MEFGILFVFFGGLFLYVVFKIRFWLEKRGVAVSDWGMGCMGGVLLFVIMAALFLWAISLGK